MAKQSGPGTAPDALDLRLAQVLQTESINPHSDMVWARLMQKADNTPRQVHTLEELAARLDQPKSANIERGQRPSSGKSERMVDQLMRSEVTSFKTLTALAKATPGIVIQVDFQGQLNGQRCNSIFIKLGVPLHDGRIHGSGTFARTIAHAEQQIEAGKAIEYYAKGALPDQITLHKPDGSAAFRGEVKFYQLATGKPS